MAHGTHVFAGVVIAGGLGLCMWVLDDYWVGLVTAGVCLAVVLLSITLTTGVGGTISLCQASFAAVGAFATAKLVQQRHVGDGGDRARPPLVAAAGRA